MYLLKLALRPWRQAPLSQLFSAFAVAFLLLILGLLFWIQAGLKPVLARLQGEQVMTVYLNSSVENKYEEKMQEKVQSALSLDKTIDVKLVSVPRFISLIKEQYPELGRELEDLGKDTHEVIPRYLSVSGFLPKDAVSRIKNIPGVESVETSKDRYRNVVGAFSTLKWLVQVLMGGMCLALLTGLVHLARMNAYLHKDSLSILKFWGANQITLMAPSLMSGLLVGILGGIIAASGWAVVGLRMTVHVRTLSSFLKGMPSVSSYLALFLFLSGGAMGLLAGLFGSFSAGQARRDGGYSS